MNEFDLFSQTEPLSPPRELTERISGQVLRDLDPPLTAILSKIFFLHAAAGGFTLLFCPQFGINLGGGMGMMALFMNLGDQACMIGCGAFFMAGGALASSLLLRPEEMTKLRRSELFWVPVLSLVLLSVLVCSGGAFLLELGFFWLLGSTLGGLGGLELGWTFRKWLRGSL